MRIGGDILKVPTEVQVRDKLQSHAMIRRSEEMEQAIYREFVESITVTSEVLEVLVRMPEIASIEQAKEFLRETRGSRRAASIDLRSRGGLRWIATGLPPLAASRRSWSIGQQRQPTLRSHPLP